MPKPSDDLDRARLALYVRNRRRQQGNQTRKELAIRSRVSYRTLTDLEQGVSVGKETMAAAEAALEWPPGACDRILRGLEPWPDAPERSAVEYLEETPGLDEAFKAGLIALVKAHLDRQGGNGEASGS